MCVSMCASECACLCALLCFAFVMIMSIKQESTRTRLCPIVHCPLWFLWVSLIEFPHSVASNGTLRARSQPLRRLTSSALNVSFWILRYIAQYISVALSTHQLQFQFMQKVLRFGHSPSLLLLLPLFLLKNNCRHVAKRPSSLTDRQRDSKRDRGKREVGRPATPDWQRSSIRDLRLSTWVAWA